MQNNNEKLQVAIIGTGNRTRKVYTPLFKSIKDEIEIVAVCDPNRESCEEYANQLGVKPYLSLKELIKDRIINAALVVCPIDIHYAISVYLSENKIHHLIETSMCSTIEQGQIMVKKAEENNVIMRIAENFFRFPFDRIAREIKKTNFLGEIKRIVCYHDHTGYHNNSRWTYFFEEYPTSVQCIDHIMPTTPHNSMAHRQHTSEKFTSRFFHFPNDKLVIDQAANIKGMLGRTGRPGITSIEGARGAISRWITSNWFGDGEVRYCSNSSLENGAIADEIYPIINEAEKNCWTLTYVDLPSERVSFTNNNYHLSEENIKYTSPGTKNIIRDYYGSALMSAITDFTGAVMRNEDSEFTGEDALMSMMMESGAKESALNHGEAIKLPTNIELEVDKRQLNELEKKNGINPMDVEQIIDQSIARP